MIGEPGIDWLIGIGVEITVNPSFRCQDYVEDSRPVESYSQSRGRCLGCMNHGCGAVERIAVQLPRPV